MKKLMFLLAMLPAISYCQDSTAIGFKDNTQDIPAKENVMSLRNFPTVRHPYQYHSPKLMAYAPSAAFVFAGGIFKELREASMFYRIKDGGFFDGRNSWKRKYQNGDYKQGEAFPLSTSLLVGFTDNVHFSQMMYGQCDAWSAVMMPYDPNRKFGHLAALVGARTGIEAIARFIVYSFTKNGNRQEMR